MDTLIAIYNNYGRRIGVERRFDCYIDGYIYVYENLIGYKTIRMHNIHNNCVLEYMKGFNIGRLLRLGYSIMLSKDVDYNWIIKDIYNLNKIYNIPNIEALLTMVIGNRDHDLDFLMITKGVSQRLRNLVIETYPILRDLAYVRPNSTLVHDAFSSYKLEAMLKRDLYTRIDTILADTSLPHIEIYSDDDSLLIYETDCSFNISPEYGRIIEDTTENCSEITDPNTNLLEDEYNEDIGCYYSTIRSVSSSEVLYLYNIGDMPYAVVVGNSESAMDILDYMRDDIVVKIYSKCTANAFIDWLHSIISPVDIFSRFECATDFINAIMSCTRRDLIHVNWTGYNTIKFIDEPYDSYITYNEATNILSRLRSHSMYNTF